jgi:phosphocarrier protein HPr
MKEICVKLQSIDDVKTFVQLVNEYPYEIDLISGRHVVDAKSIMGIFSLDLTEPLTVQIHSDDPADLPDRLIEQYT